MFKTLLQVLHKISSRYLLQREMQQNHLDYLWSQNQRILIRHLLRIKNQRKRPKEKVVMMTLHHSFRMV